MHSLANLYPLLHNFNVALKYICTDTSDAAPALASHFPGAKATHRLEDILEDSEVAGVFVCAAPAQHFSIARRLLQAGKHTFIEKPPCYSLDELTTLVKEKKDLNCVVGLQKRQGTANRLLTKKIKTATHYHCTYGMGPYPEGNPIYELFIHPVDKFQQHKGKEKIQWIKEHTPAMVKTFLLALEHPQTTGILELSTEYNWNQPADNLVIHTHKEILTVRYPNFVQGEEKGATLAGIPLEKVGDHPLLTRTYLNNDGTIPSLENSNLYIQGFYGAVSNFVRAVEENTIDKSAQVDSLHPVFEILDALHHASAKRS